MPASRRSGFTLIEMLVVIAIIAILVFLLMPAVQKVREAASRTECVNNMKQMAAACHMYHDMNNRLPSGNVPLDAISPYYGWSWQALILPYMEQGNVFNQAEAFGKVSAWPYGDPPNPALAIKIPSYTCPSDERSLVVQTVDGYLVAFTSYMGVSGLSADPTPPSPATSTRDGIFYSGSHVRFVDIRDGTSNTLLIGERPPSGDLLFGWWFAGGGYDMMGEAGDNVMGVREYNYARSVFVVNATGGYTPITCPPSKVNYQDGSINDPCDQVHYWSMHPNGANFALADGSIRFILYSADPQIPVLATRAGGEPVGDF